MKRGFIIAGIVLILALVAVGLYFLLFWGKGGGLTAVPGTNPFGDTGSDTEQKNVQEVGQTIASAGTEVAPRLVRITEGPVARGALASYIPATLAPAASTTASTTPRAEATPAEVRIEYVERESGNIYAYQAHARSLTRLTNKTLPGIQEAVWLADGSLAYVRFLETAAGVDHINTYALPAAGDGGYFLETDLAQVAVNGTSTVFTLLSGTTGSTATVATPSGTGVRTVFTSPLSALRAEFSGNDFVATTKASTASPGYAFLVDGKSGGFSRLIGPWAGLATLASPSGEYLLYSYVDRGRLYLSFLNMKSRASIALPLSTPAEKCAWALDSASIYCAVPRTLPNGLPDAWYQGTVQLSDRIWRIDLADRTATLVVDPVQLGKVDIDAVALTLDRANDMLVFMNKSDGSLWAYDL